MVKLNYYFRLFLLLLVVFFIPIGYTLTAMLETIQCLTLALMMQKYHTVFVKMCVTQYVLKFPHTLWFDSAGTARCILNEQCFSSI